MIADAIELQPIGVVHSPFSEPPGTPIQPIGGRDIQCTVEVFSEHAAGLADLDGFSHVFLITHLHRTVGCRLKVRPFLDDVPRGVFATRAPSRPNPLGLSLVRLLRVEDNVLHIEGIDLIDGTPLLDIKPYVPELDACGEVHTGWLSGKADAMAEQRADRRFQDDEDSG